VNGFRHADARKVAVALIRKDNRVRVGALEARRHGGCAPVRGFDHIAGKVVVSQHRAAHGGDPDGFPLDAEGIDGFRHEAVNDAVRAARAVMRCYGQKRVGMF
jgi:hypothetical protein